MTTPTTTRRWPHDVSYFFGGMFFVNAMPHFLAGISGSPFQSPFASPPGIGLSTALVNVGWGLANFVVAYLLLVRVGRFDFRSWRHVAPFMSGVSVMAFFLASHFGPLHGGTLE